MEKLEFKSDIQVSTDRIYYAAGDPISIVSSKRRKSGDKHIEVRTNVKRQTGRLYFVRDGDLYSVEAGRPKGR